MTYDVDLNDRRVSVTASSGQTIFDIDFPVIDATDIVVYKNGVVLDGGVYTVNVDAMTVTLNSGAATGDNIVIEGATQPVRKTSYPQSGGFRSELLNTDMRRLTYLAQELATKTSRSFTLAANESADVAAKFPKRVAGKMLKWGDNPADGLVNSDSDIDNLDDAVMAAETAQMAAESAAASAATDATAADVARSAAESAAAGMKWRPSVRVATTANITLSGTQTIDGVAVVVGDRVLVKDQSTASQNGVYIVSLGTWSRASDADSWAELVSQVVAVEEGTVYADYTFICTVDKTGTLGTTAIAWSTFKVIIQDGAVSTTAKIADGIITYVKMAASAIASLSDWANGTANKLLTAANFLPAVLAALGFNKNFESSEQTITYGNTHTVNHGLGATPKWASVVARCKTAENGFSVGQELTIYPFVDVGSGTSFYGGMLYCDSTVVGVHIKSSGIIGYNPSTGEGPILTAANWKLVFRALA